MDPLADDAPAWTPYHYVHNNPVILTDPTGMSADCEGCPDHIYAPIADHVYTKNLAKGMTTSNGWEVINVDKDKQGYQGALYRGNENSGYEGEYIYASAGTDPTTWGDLKNNFQQLNGKSSFQYAKSVDVALDLKDKYPTVSFTGHSLGGGLASANAMATEGKAVTFNAAGLSKGTKNTLGLNNKKANISANIISGEVIHHYQSSFGVRAEGNITMWPTPRDYGFGSKSILKGLKAYYGGAFSKRFLNHSIKNFLPPN